MREVMTPIARPPTAPARTPNNTSMGKHSIQPLRAFFGENTTSLSRPTPKPRPAWPNRDSILEVARVKHPSVLGEMLAGYLRLLPLANLATGADFHS